MKEIEYIKITNRTKISSGIAVLRGAVVGKEYGIPPAEWTKILTSLCKIEENLLEEVLVDTET